MPSGENKGTVEHPQVGDRHRGLIIGKLPKAAWFLYLGNRWVLERTPMPQRCAPCSRAINQDLGSWPLFYLLNSDKKFQVVKKGEDGCN